MISFSSFPQPIQYDTHNAHGKVRREADEDDEMDYEFDDDVSGGKLTSPGEPIASSHAFMRCVATTQ